MANYKSLIRRELSRRRKSRYGVTPQALDPTFGEMNLFEKALDLISRPGRAVTGAARAIGRGENVGKAFVEGITGKGKTSYSDILGDIGMKKGVARSVLGFIGDVALDPTSHLGVGPVAKAGSIAVKGTTKALSKAGVSKVAELTERAGRALGTKIGSMSDDRLVALANFASRRSPEARTLLRDLTPAQMRSEAGVKAISKGLAVKPIEKAIAKEPGKLVAPSAIKFGIGKASVPLIKTETIKKAVKPVYEGAKKVPGVGAVLRGIERVGGKGIAAAKSFFGKAGHPEVRAAEEAARDLMNLRKAEAGRAAEELVADLKKAGFKDEAGLKKAHEEIVRTIEGVLTQKLIRDPSKFDDVLKASVAGLERRLSKLAGKAIPIEGAIARIRSRVARLEALKVPQKVEKKALLEMGRGGAPVIEKEAAKLTKEEAKVALKSLKESDVIGKLKSVAPGGISMSTKAGKMAEELTTAAIPKNLIRRGGMPLDEAASMLGYGSDEELLRALEKAHASRQKVIKEASGVKVSGEAYGKASEKFFRGAVEKRAAELEKSLASKRAQLEAAKGKPGYDALKKEIADIEGQIAKAREPAIYQVREKYVSQVPGIQAVGEKIKGRLAKMLEEEQRLLTLPPEAREFYLPHYFKPEIEKALRETVYGPGAGAVLRTGVSGATVKAALRRQTRKGVLELTLADMIHGGLIDPDKLEKILAQKGLTLSATDKLVFETNPIAAALRRELSHVKAVSAAQMRDDIMQSPTFLKSRVNMMNEDGVQRIGKLLDQHRDHAVYVTTKDYIEHFMTDAQREALRRGGRPELVRSLAVKLDPSDLEDLAKRVGPGVNKVDGFVLPEEIVNHLNKAHGFTFAPEAVGEFLRMFDQMQGWWKTFATVIRPGFHVRNAISNMWQMFLAGMRNPAHMLTAGAMQRGNFKAFGQIAGRDPEEVWKLAQEMGVVRTGWVGAAEEFVEQTTRPSRNILSARGPVARAGQKVGASVEDNARLALFIDSLEKGMDPKTAAWNVKKYLFDYTSLSNVEKSVLRRVMPFYSWTRFSIPLAAERLVMDPGKVGILGKARAEADKEFKELDRPAVAEWIQKSFGIPFKRNPDGSVSYVILGGLIPTVDLARMDSKQLVGMISPFLKVPIEQAFNEDFFRARPITRFPGERTEMFGLPMSPRMAHLARNLVILGQVDRALFQKERVSLGEGLMFLGTGIKPERQEPERQFKSFFLRQQYEAGRLRNEAKTARAQGREVVAEALEGRADQIEGRGEVARRKAVDLNPLTFQRPKTTKPEMPQTMAQVIARMRAQARKKAQ